MIRERYEKIKAFTLLELSIVILIIGLLIGAIMAGDEIIYNAQVKKQITDMDQHKQAFNVFSDKFNHFPGDFNGASAAFGCTAGSVPVGCNGNGNDSIDDLSYPNGSPAGQGAEVLRAWQHMSLANILPNAYTGITVTANTAVLGVNVPASSVEPGGYTLTTQNFESYGVNGTQLVLGIAGAGAQTFTNARKPDFAKFVDNKMDDGLPMSGQVTTNNAGCTTGANAYSAVKTVSCIIAYRVDKH